MSQHPKHMDPAVMRAYLEEIGRIGGAVTLEKYGKEHYRRLGQLSAAKRKAHKEAND